MVRRNGVLSAGTPDGSGTASQFQVISLSDATNPQIREYKRRKPHKKTKAGCLSCKQRKVKVRPKLPVPPAPQFRARLPIRAVPLTGNWANAGGYGRVFVQQCDLTKPVCVRCRRNDRPCEYAPDEKTPSPVRPSFRCLTAAVLPASSPECGTASAQLLHHFHTNWTRLFGMPTLTGSLLPMAFQYPHVRNTLMAVAASHLRHAVPALKDHRLAEHSQQSLALAAYQRALATPLTVHGQAGVDSLLMTAMLMNMLAFILPDDEDDDTRAGEPDPARSWVFSPREDRLGWLALLMGLSPLLVATRPWHAKSFLAPVFLNSDDERRTLTGTWQGLHRVPVAWTTLLGLDREAPPPLLRHGHGSTSTADAGRLFRTPLRVLAEIRALEPSRRNLLLYFQFLGTLENEFRLLLYYRDEKALWVAGMWLGLMCRFEGIWWCHGRTRRDFKAIRMWLHQVGVERRPGQEGFLWQEVIRDLDATWGYRFDLAA